MESQKESTCPIRTWKVFHSKTQREFTRLSENLMTFRLTKFSRICSSKSLSLRTTNLCRVVVDSDSQPSAGNKSPTKRDQQLQAQQISPDRVLLKEELTLQLPRNRTSPMRMSSKMSKTCSNKRKWLTKHKLRKVQK